VTLSHDELQSLLGAYALHAVEPQEAEAVERHVDECPRCRAELSGYLRAAPLLGAQGGEPPEGLWEDILSSIEQRPVSGVPRAVRRATRPRRWTGYRRVVAVVAAVVVALLVASVTVLAVRVHDLQTRSSSEQLQQAANAALTTPGHQIVELATPSELPAASVVVLTDGSAYWYGSSLPSLPTGRTYQLWAASKGGIVSLGLLGSAKGVAALRLEDGMTALMVTAEPAGGVAQPNTPVLARGPITRL
jgi:Anti-sigma-K factor rskA/Putative zinc-finger